MNDLEGDSVIIDEKISRKVFSCPGSLLGDDGDELIKRSGGYEGSDRHPFMIDRDRIVYSSAFRKLNSKTHNFSTRYDEDTRTRLTHTLEVCQLAIQLSNALGLNEYLTAAIAFGHDLGQPAFGPVGEKTLNLLMNNCPPEIPNNITRVSDDLGFNHNIQALRVCSFIEKRFDDSDKKGLNLTNFTLYGLYCHDYDIVLNADSKICTYALNDAKKKKFACYREAKVRDCPNNGKLTLMKVEDRFKELITFPGNNDEAKYAWSLEAYVVRIANEIARRHHDIEDGLAMEIFSKSDIIDLINSFQSVDKLKNKYWDKRTIERLHNDFELLAKAAELRNTYFLPKVARFLVGLMIADITANAKQNLNKYAQIIERADFIQWYKQVDYEDTNDIIDFSKKFKDDNDKLQKYLKDRINHSHIMQKTAGQGGHTIKKLFEAYLYNPRLLPDEYILLLVDNYKNYSGVLSNLDKKNLELFSTDLSFYKEHTYGKAIGDFRNILSDNLVSLYKSQRFFDTLYRTITDCISQMTDQGALREYYKIYG